jgi:hypothetical protein
MYPHWNARDNYRFGVKKKKRKKDKDLMGSEPPGTASEEHHGNCQEKPNSGDYLKRSIFTSK